MTIRSAGKSTRNVKDRKEVKNLPVKRTSLRQFKNVKGGSRQSARHFNGFVGRISSG